MKQLVIGSRGSKLALWQAEWVRSRLAAIDARIHVRIEIIKTTGDLMRDVSLTVIGGKGVFTKEIEQALLERRIDLAVHSLKDLPTLIPDGLAISAVTEREDPRDALVQRAGEDREGASLKSLVHGATVGTSSQRRTAQLKNIRPDIRIKDLRGNVDTRLRKLDEGEYDALILAAAGLRRLGFERRISAYIPIETMLPAVGQGALGLETRADDEDAIGVVSKLNHAATRLACTAERALLRNLGGGCQVPIAAHAVVENENLLMDGLVAAPDGATILRDAVTGKALEAEMLGEKLAENLRARGALELLAEK
jgi:hydroxymethylbilane synthase